MKCPTNQASVSLSAFRTSRRARNTYIEGLLQVSVFFHPKASWLQVGQASLQSVCVQSLLLGDYCVLRIVLRADRRRECSEQDSKIK